MIIQIFASKRSLKNISKTSLIWRRRIEENVESALSQYQIQLWVSLWVSSESVSDSVLSQSLSQLWVSLWVRCWKILSSHFWETSTRGSGTHFIFKELRKSKYHLWILIEGSLRYLGRNNTERLFESRRKLLSQSEIEDHPWNNTENRLIFIMCCDKIWSRLGILLSRVRKMSA